MAEHQLTCAHCGNQLPNDVHSLRRYCSSICARRAEKVRRQEAQPPRVCFNCDKTFKPKGKDRAKFCGRPCAFAFRADAKALREMICVSVKVKRNAASRIKPEPKRPRDYYTARIDGVCRNCGVDFDRTSEGATRYMCSASCHKQATARVKRAGRSKRKAMERGARVGEAIDPIKVFERDAWRCGICGCKTLRSKRGTYHTKAPEVDHIVAIANGGLHSWANVQTSCRACNGRKGATDFGQLMFFPAA